MLFRSALDLVVAEVVRQEPDTSFNLLGLGPRAMINDADLDATGLIRPGSRAGYRLLVAGAMEGVDAYREWAGARVEAGQRVESVREARPEVRVALERAERFLGLAALVSVALAAVAIALATRRYMQRHLDACAMLRCLGASRGRVVCAYALQGGLLGLIGGGAGSLAGALAQEGLDRKSTRLNSSH